MTPLIFAILGCTLMINGSQEDNDGMWISGMLMAWLAFFFSASL